MVRGELMRRTCESLGAGPILYRAVDSKGATIDFLLSETRDLTAARNFFHKALAAPGHPRPRVITVDGNPSYPTVIDELKQQRALGRRCYCRVVPYLNNIVEQDHRAIKRERPRRFTLRACGFTVAVATRLFRYLRALPFSFIDLAVATGHHWPPKIWA